MNPNRGETQAAIEKGWVTIAKNLVKYNAEIDSGPKLLEIAVKRRLKEVIELLLEGGLGINDGYRGHSVLRYTALSDEPVNYYVNVDNYDINLCIRADIVKFLLEHGADVELNMKSGKTPLHIVAQKDDACLTAMHLAVKKKHKNIVEFFIQRGATVNTKNIIGESLVYTAVQNGTIDSCSLLLKNVADANVQDTDGKTALHLAILMKHKGTIKSLLEHDVDVNFKTDNGDSLLHLAVRKKVRLVCKLLLEKGADVNAQNEDGVTALYLSIQNKCKGIVHVLLRHGANVNMTTKIGESLLHVVVETGGKAMKELCKLLIEEGADVNAQDERGFTPISLAVQKRREDVAQMFLKHGARVDLRIDRNQTLLHYAARMEAYTVCKVLLERRVDVNAEDEDGSTALHVAAEIGKTRMLEILMNSGAHIDSKDNAGNTALHRASKFGRVRAVLTLTEYGSDVNIVNKSGQTALQVVNSYTTTSRKTTPIIQEDLLKMQIATLVINKGNVNDLNITTEIEDQSQFQKKCNEEINEMKSTIINSNVTFLDILTKPTNQVASFARNKDILQAMRQKNYKDRFPEYAGMIERRFKRGIARMRLLDEGNQFFHSRFNIFCNMPYVCVKKILSHLNNSDLTSLKVAREILY